MTDQVRRSRRTTYNGCFSDPDKRVSHEFHQESKGFAGVLLATIGLGFGTAASAAPYALGDVFASTGSGKVNVSQSGVLKQTLDTGLGGFSREARSTRTETSMSPRSAPTSFQIRQQRQPGRCQLGQRYCERRSIVFDAAGNAYLGNAGAMQIQKVDSTGTPSPTSRRCRTPTGSTSQPIRRPCSKAMKATPFAKSTPQPTSTRCFQRLLRFAVRQALSGRWRRDRRVERRKRPTAGI